MSNKTTNNNNSKKLTFEQKALIKNQDEGILGPEDVHAGNVAKAYCAVTPGSNGQPVLLKTAHARGCTCPMCQTYEAIKERVEGIKANNMSYDHKVTRKAKKLLKEADAWAQDLGVLVPRTKLEDQEFLAMYQEAVWLSKHQGFEHTVGMILPVAGGGAWTPANCVVRQVTIENLWQRSTEARWDQLDVKSKIAHIKAGMSFTDAMFLQGLSA